MRNSRAKILAALVSVALCGTLTASAQDKAHAKADKPAAAKASPVGSPSAKPSSTPTPAPVAKVKPGDIITKSNASLVEGLVSPGNYELVKQGMSMDIVEPEKLEWPPPYKTATEKYSPQVKLLPSGSLSGYVAGLPFPLLDANDPNAADKIMWNFSYRPLYSDDIDLRYPEIAAYAKNSTGSPLSYFSVGHFAIYNNIGRIDVPPTPTDPDAQASGVRMRFGYYPFLEPSMMRGFGLIGMRYIDPNTEDNAWVFNPDTRRLRRLSPELMSDAIAMLPGFSGGAGGGAGGLAAGGVGAGVAGGANANTIDPDSFFGFSAKVEDYTYKFLGAKKMLASVNAVHSPEKGCRADGNRTICPENWEMRDLYVIQADSKPGRDVTIPRRILYIDSEDWFVTASDQYDREGKLWKTLALFNTYRDRPVPDASIAIYPYKR
ncbi:MAG TPA: DUF1329 domain-containing protein, partial [Candidatus Binataceae bacterium]|nr:DUF1329 domain-containing protein [Candidatus Binataceae bacterium]